MSNPYRNWPNCLLDGEVGRAYRFKVAAKREHAHRVFAAIQAVLAVVASWEQASALWEQASALWERGSAQYTLEKCESMQRACGWLPK